ncbi:MAG: electron transport complex subunit RsxC [Candidatus Cloacimonas sp. 4484_209]|nr:MAG: electron transport complex subunit RsxC [Candidatus Cloacimonas sp. 4484_209]
MRLKTFSQGIHPVYLKELSSDKSIKKCPIPKKVIIPLSQHTGAPGKPLIAKKDRVERGQKIAEADAFITAPIHSSVTGTVKKIEKQPHPVLGSFNSIVIERDENAEVKEWERKTLNLEQLTPDDIRKKVREAGIVGLGGAAFPASVKISPPQDKPIDTIILNGCECEPYLTADHRIMLERPDDCILGLKIIMKAVNAQKGIIAVEANKMDAYHLFLEKTKNEQRIDIELLEVKYPEGAEKMLIRALLNRVVPAGGLPMDVGVVVHNVGTAVAIVEAVRDDKPLIERVVTVTGKGVNNPGNFLVPIGTPFSEVIEAAGGLKENACKVIMGGPLMGIAQTNLDIPVIKGTSGILVLTEDETDIEDEMNCIRCARCVDHCPMFLLPTEFVKFVKGEAWDRLEQYHINDCIECGSCAYTCPSKIPIVQYIKLGKLVLKNLKSKKG